MNELYFQAGGKASCLVRVMVESIIKIMDNPESNLNFRLDMNHYSISLEDICYGCAATATVANLNNEDPSEWVLQREELQYTCILQDDLVDFECVVDTIRTYPSDVELLLNECNNDLQLGQYDIDSFVRYQVEKPPPKLRSLESNYFTREQVLAFLQLADYLEKFEKHSGVV